MPEQLISQMKKRDNESREFIRTFGNFVKAYSEYLEWMKLVKEKQGDYHSESDLVEYCKKNIDLIEDIRRNGIKSAITITKDEKGLDIIDGFHRLVIAYVNKENEIKIVELYNNV